MITADAAMMESEGSIIQKAPSDCITDDLIISKNGCDYRCRLPGIAQIIASPVERDNFYGRAVTGVLCFSPHSEDRAAILISEKPVVTMKRETYGYDRPAIVEQMLFRAGDTIRFSGVNGKAYIIADGNPYRRKNETIGFRYIPEAVTIARL
jgi:hypothetical protein